MALVLCACGDVAPPTRVGALADSAAAALRAAREAGALSRAPFTLAVAEEAYARGLLESRRQELRPAPLRRFHRAVAAFDSARVRARLAARVSGSTERRERRGTDRALLEAASALAPLQDMEQRLWVPAPTRARLQRARTLASEAHGLSGLGRHGQAAERAREAFKEAGLVREAVLHVTGRYRDPSELRRWAAWVDETVAWSRRTGRAAVVVDKDAHVLVLYERGRPARTWPVDLGWNNAGVKSRLGDGATPEGRYRITKLKGPGDSRYHRALLLDYPNAADLKALQALKRSGAVSSDTRAGGLIEVHGDGGRARDWTDGCVAMANEDLDVLFGRVTVGTPITIVGSRFGDGVFSDIARRVAR